MRRATLVTILLLAIFGVVSGLESAGAQAQTSGVAANQNGATIQTTVIFREKASDCPSGYTVFIGGSGGKFPADPKICYVRAPHPAGQ